MADDDLYSSLEAIDGEKVLNWAARHNETTLARLLGEGFAQRRADALDVHDAATRIPAVARNGKHLCYAFWRDAAHPRGVWRRTALGNISRTSRTGTSSSTSTRHRRRGRELGVGRRPDESALE